MKSVGSCARWNERGRRFSTPTWEGTIMFTKNLKVRRIIQRAALVAIERLDRRILLSDCRMDTGQMIITGDANANSIVLELSGGSYTAKENGSAMSVDCTNATPGSVNAALGAGNDLLDASALSSSI